MSRFVLFLTLLVFVSLVSAQDVISGSQDEPLPPEEWLLPPEAWFRLRSKDGITCCVFSPDDKLLATGNYDGKARLWDLATGKEMFCFSHQKSLNSVAFSPDGKILATGGYDKTIQLWEVATGQRVRTLTGHENTVTCMQFSPSGKILASGSADETIRLWNITTAKETRNLRHPDNVASLAFSPNGKALVSVGGVMMRLWDVEGGKETRNWVAGQLSRISLMLVHSVAFSPDGKTLASGVGDIIRLWDLASGKEIMRLKGHENMVVVMSLAFSPDSKILASGNGMSNFTVNDEKNGIRLWDVGTGKAIRTWGGRGSVAFSSDGKLLVSGGGKGVLLWKIPEIYNIKAKLKDQRPETRIQAINSIPNEGLSNEEQTLLLDEVFSLLLDKNEKVQEAAIKKLADIGSNGAPQVLKSLNSNNPTLVARTLVLIEFPNFFRTFSNKDDESFFPLVLSLLKGKNDVIRLEAIKAIVPVAIGAKKVPEVIDSLTDALDDSNQKIKEEAINSLGFLIRNSAKKSDFKKPIRKMVEILENDKRVEIKAKAAWFFQETGEEGKEAIPVLIHCLNMKNWILSLEAKGALVKMESSLDAYLPILGNYLICSNNSSFREEIASLLFRLEKKSVLISKKIELGLKDHNPNVRKYLAGTIGTYGKKGEFALESLNKLLRDESFAVRFIAARSIWQITGCSKNLLTILADLLDHGDNEIKMLTLELLGDIGPEAQVLLPKIESMRNKKEGTLSLFAEIAIKRISKK